MALTEAIEAFLAEPRNVMVAGIRRDGTPHLTPNWSVWDGARFYVSTTRHRAKYAVFRRDPRAELAIDDSEGFRTVLVRAAAEIREDIAAELPRFRAPGAKYGRPVLSDEELLTSLAEEGRVLLAFTPERPMGAWTCWGLN